MGSLAKGSLRKVCGNSAEICKKYVSLRQERVRKFCGKFAEISRRLRKIFCNDPFPNDPISELLRIALRAAGKSVKKFSAASKFAGKLFQQGISDSHPKDPAILKILRL